MEESAFPRATTNTEQKSKRPRLILFLVLFLLILGGILFGASKLLSPKQDEQQEVASANIAPTAVVVQSDTPVPEETNSPTPKTTSIPSPTTKQTVADAGDLARSNLTVEIQNGSGVAGVASKMADLLKGLGYPISGTGNADNFDYTNVTIKIKSTKSKYLPLLKKDISASYTVGATSTSLASGSADALVIVGK